MRKDDRVHRPRADMLFDGKRLIYGGIEILHALHKSGSRSMDIQGLFAVACVSDMATSTQWYACLIGRGPDDRPMETLVQWRNLGGAGLQLVVDADKAGTSLITIVTPAMDRAREKLTAASLKLGPDIQGDFGTIAQIDDPDGNRITLAEPPKGM